MLEEHVPSVKRADLSKDARADWLEVRKQVYDCQKWHWDVWEEEVTYYPGHGVTMPKYSRTFVDNVKLTAENCAVLADVLVRREEDKKYDLITYLKKNTKYAK